MLASLTKKKPGDKEMPPGLLKVWNAD